MLSLPPGDGAWVVTMENGSPPFEATSVNSKGEIMVTANPIDPPNFYRCRRTLNLSEQIRVKSAIASLRPDEWKVQYGAIPEEDPKVPYALMLRHRIHDKATEHSTVWSEAVESCVNGPGSCRPSYMEEPFPRDLVAIRDVLRATATPFHESCGSQKEPARK
jgi:hypothetical protein